MAVECSIYQKYNKTRNIFKKDNCRRLISVLQDRQTDRQTDSMTLAEPTPDMTERKCFSNVLTARVLKSRWTETTRAVEQSL